MWVNIPEYTSWGIAEGVLWKFRGKRFAEDTEEITEGIPEGYSENNSWKNPERISSQNKKKLGEMSAETSDGNSEKSSGRIAE